MRRKTGFTLIELLVVVSIIALLVAMLLPTLGRARQLATKASCQSQMAGYGRQIKMYITQYKAYPHFAPSTIEKGVPGHAFGQPSCTYAYPKFYAILDAQGFQGSIPTTYGNFVYDWQRDEVWDKAFCPGMDWMALWDWAEQQDSAGNDKPYMHRAAMGYQWNFALRCAVPDTPTMSKRGRGRWLNLLEHSDTAGPNDDTYWMDWRIWLRDGQMYGTQAISDEEINQPASIAEAWDSWDLASAPGVSKTDANVENVLPGWHIGPQTDGTNGWFMMNAARHPDGPNILYADGHVASDANRPVSPGDLGPCPAGSWDGIRAVSWNDYHETFGTLWHMLPKREFQNK